jgi:hypothetical protein
MTVRTISERELVETATEIITLKPYDKWQIAKVLLRIYNRGWDDSYGECVKAGDAIIRDREIS